MPRAAKKAPNRGPEGLNPADPGIRLLAGALAGADPAQVLLVHCGDLPGLRPGATRLISDLRERGSAHSMCVESLDPGARFGHAVLWPRAHLGKDFSTSCMAIAARHVRPGGRIYLAARKQKGLQSLARELRALTAEPVTVERSRGYHLLVVQRPERVDAAALAAAIDRHYVFSHPALGDLELCAGPGVFSRKGLDGGTLALIEDATETVRLAPERIVDLGCGVAPLALWAAQRWPNARVLGVDTNLVALRWAATNVQRAGLDTRVYLRASDGLPDEEHAPEGFRGHADLVLVNPPTHADADALRALLAPLRTWTRSKARALLVVARPAQIPGALEAAGARVQERRRGAYTILDARF